MRTWQTQRGFTLVELLVVLMIIAGLGVGSVSMVNMLAAGDLRGEALRLTSAIKYTYSQAAVNNTRYRLVLDIDSGAFHTEVVDSALVEDAPGQGGASAGDEDLLTEEAREAGRLKKREEDLFDEESDNPFGINRRVSYQRVQDGVIKPGVFKHEVKIKRVVVGETRDVTQGKVYLNFFPNGFQEQALIYLMDRNGAVFTLRTEPLTGRVIVSGDELEVPADFGVLEEKD